MLGLCSLQVPLDGASTSLEEGKAIRSVTRNCVACRRRSLRPPLMGQLPVERISPDLVFNRVGVDYAGPFYVKYGYVRKPTLVKSYVCVFVSLSIKAVHLELVSDLSTEAFIACLRRFIARRGKPSLIWSDHGSNFVGKSKSFYRNPTTFQIFVPCRASNGNLSLKEPPTLEGCGKPL